MAHQQCGPVYEETCFNLYGNNRTTPTNTSASRTKPLPEKETRKYCNNACIVSAFAFGIGIIALLGVVLANQMSDYDASSEQMRLPDSCLTLRQRKVQDTGIHKIQLLEENVPTEIFCDMETDGGGWSLVASIHEDDIKAKCSRHDLWSDYVRPEGSFKGKSNWENEMGFGDVRRALFADYKSPAYHRMQASDVMIWHVPSGMAITVAKNNSMLRYRTSNNFLRKYGGNMQMLYNKFFPLSPKLDHDVIDDFLTPIIQSFSGIKYTISGWYAHRMPSAGSVSISDRRMFSPGNRVYFSSSDSPSISVNVKYGMEYRFTNVISHTLATSSLTTPFTFLAAVRNDFQRTSHYQIGVRSYRSFSNDVVSRFEGNATIGNFRLQYHVIQFHVSDDWYHTECRFHFYVSNLKDWKSVTPTQFTQYSESTSGRSYKTASYRIYGRPARILYGYMLLTRIAGQNYTKDDLDEIASSVLRNVAFYPNLMDAWSDRSTLVVPVMFDFGTKQTVIKSTPTTMRKYITPGNLQFRAYNFTGYPSALCPGASVSSPSPEYVCVGGISNDITADGTCGDFAGWSGTSRDNILPTGATGFAHSSADISSTLLIFYR